jgi:dUTP pyrophosphatase
MTFKCKDVYLKETSTVVGPYEKDGPLGEYFDKEHNDLYFGTDSWELAEQKLVEEAIIPKYAHKNDAGLDLTATSYTYDKGNHVYGTGLAIEIPDGFVGLIFPRSSNRKTDCYMANHVGVIDSGYRGEIMVTFKHRDKNAYIDERPYKVGDRIAQLIIMPYPKINFVEVEDLSDSERGEDGHGSTGK